MNADPDRTLLAASLAFAGAAVLGSAVAFREDLPGQPCGISIPLSVPAGLLVGWGAGVAAPWPMPAAAFIAAARSQRTRPHALTGAVCAGIGIGCVLGTAIEPVTRRPRSWSPTTRLAIASNIAASAVLTVAGLRHRAAAKALRLRDQANQQRPDHVQITGIQTLKFLPCAWWLRSSQFELFTSSAGRRVRAVVVSCSQRPIGWCPAVL